MNKDMNYSLVGTVLFLLALGFFVANRYAHIALFSAAWVLLAGVFVAVSYVIKARYKATQTKLTITAKSLLDTYVLIIGYVLVSIASVQLSSQPTLSAVLGVFGLVGVVLVMMFQNDVVGLTNSEQAVLTTVSMLLIVAGSFAAATNVLPWQASVVLAILGAVGLGLKEALGSLPAPTAPAKTPKTQ